MTCTWEGSVRNVFTFCLIVTTLGLELNASAGHDTSSQHVTVKLLLHGKTKDIEGILGVFQLFIVIDGFDLGLSLGDVDVIVDVIGHTAPARNMQCSIIWTVLFTYLALRPPSQIPSPSEKEQ